jgi:hypothetical protein
MKKLIITLAALAAGLLAPAAPAAAAGTCTVTNQTAPAQGASATKVTWTWAVSCSGVATYNVYTSATDTTTGKSYGTTGTGSPYSTATAGATETKTIPTCVATDNWQDKVTVRSSGGALLAGPVVMPVPAAPICGSPPPPPPPPPPPGAIKHIILIMEENHSLADVTAGMPYLTGLGQTYAHATALKAIQHPSLPNYFAITAGTTFGVGSDCGTTTSTCSQSGDNIFHQAESAGGWAGWAESMPTNCAKANHTPYVVHHAVAPFYTDLADCATNDVPFDPAAPPPITAGFTLLTPNNNHNGHSSTLGAADAWLQQVIPELQADPAYADGSTLIEVTFDEGVSTNQTVAAIFINPALSGVTVTQAATHYSTLKLNEDLLGVPELNNAATAPDIRGALGL